MPWDVCTRFQVRSCLLRPSSWKHSQRNLCLTNALGIVPSKLTIKTKHHNLGMLYSTSLVPGSPLCEKSELRNRKIRQRNRRRVLAPALSITSWFALGKFSSVKSCIYLFICFLQWVFFWGGVWGVGRVEHPSMNECMWKSEGNLRSWFCLSTVWICGVQLKSRPVW